MTLVDVLILRQKLVVVTEFLNFVVAREHRLVAQCVRAILTHGATIQRLVENNNASSDWFAHNSAAKSH